VDEDVEMALQSGSVALLCVALSQSRFCPGAVLHEAIETKKYDAVALLLEQGPRNLLHEEFGGLSPLARVIARANCDKSDMVKLFLDYGANPNQRSGPSLDTPLHEASSRVNTLAMRLLLERGGDANITNQDKATPLHVACRSLGSLHPIGAKREVVSLLLESGADPTLMDKHGMKASDYLDQMVKMSAWMYVKADDNLKITSKNLRRAEALWIHKTVAFASGRGHSDKCFRLLPLHVVDLIVGFLVSMDVDF
jgi:ankyrin repeat protein